mgnify:CR=1 FL=1
MYDDTELLEDVAIDTKQAMEMCSIYRDILSGTMDAYASVISNNLNIVMKVLTSITLVISIPTLIASLFGMNTWVPGQSSLVGISLENVVGVEFVLHKTGNNRVVSRKRRGKIYQRIFKVEHLNKLFVLGRLMQLGKRIYGKRFRCQGLLDKFDESVG